MKHKVFALVIAALLLQGLLIIPVTSGQQVAVWPTEEWAVSTPEAQGMNSQQLADFLATWTQPQYNMDSIVVVRNGYIVAEANSPMIQSDTLHHVHSVAKSVMSALVGVLLQDELLDSLDTPVLSFFPERTVANVDDRKQAMTVRDLLTMSAGLECHDIDAPAGQPGTGDLMERSSDWLQYSLDMPMAADPGSAWNYCSPFTQILSGIVTELTGKSALDYASEKLFAPLGITSYAWGSGPNNLTVGAGALELTARDMAKIGYLFLNHGQWDDQQIMPADFADAAISNQIATIFDPSITYGYQWWRFEPINLSFALGTAGQYIMVMPDKNLIIAVTGGMTENLRVPLESPMLFASTQLSTSATALPDDPDGVAALTNAIDAIATETPQPVPAEPEIAGQISGVSYYLFNPGLFLSSGYFQFSGKYRYDLDSLNVQTLRLTFPPDAAEAALTLNFTDGGTWEVPVGLDGVYRVSEGRLRTVGVRGGWLGDGDGRVR